MKALLAEQQTVNVNPLSLKRVDESEPEPAVEREPAADRAARPRNGRWLLISALVLIAGGGWFIYAQVIGAGKTASAKSAAEGGAAPQGKATLGFVSKDGAGGANSKGLPSTRIETIRAEVSNRYETLRLTGNLMADEKASVASNTSGIAAEVRVDRGSLVRKGDVLVQIDPTDAMNKLKEGNAMLKELKARLGLKDEMPKDVMAFAESEPEVQLARASFELAESNLRRANDLITKKAISKESFDQTKTERELAYQRYCQSKLLIQQALATCETAIMKLEILDKAVKDTSIRAPFDGWVAEKLVSVGEQISSGMQATTVVTLVRINPLRLSLTVPQQSVRFVTPGQTVRFKVDSFPDHDDFEAKVRYIAPIVTHDTRSMLVEAVVPNPDGKLYPGMFVTAELELKKQQPGVFAPLTAVEKTGEVARVFVVQDGIAREKVVALGEEENGKVEIRNGLTGKEILVANPKLVRDGDKVR